MYISFRVSYRRWSRAYEILNLLERHCHSEKVYLMQGFSTCISDRLLLPCRGVTCTMFSRISDLYSPEVNGPHKFAHNSKRYVDPLETTQDLLEYMK